VGQVNVAVGYVSLYSNTTGGGNTALGYSSLTRNTSGVRNVAVGYYAGFQRTTGDDNIDIGNTGKAAESNTIRIGDGAIQKNTFIAGISGATIARGVGVLIDGRGHLGTNNSSARFKEQIKPMDKSSEGILALQPVTFHYKKELDPEGVPQFGLIAEEVEKVNPDLVARDEQGKPYTVRYEAVNAMLLNEFLKEHKKVEEQVRINEEQEAAIAQQKEDFQAFIAQQEKEIQSLTEALKAQAAEIQKVSDVIKAQVDPRVVVNK
jgi:hypothetical protein